MVGKRSPEVRIEILERANNEKESEIRKLKRQLANAEGLDAERYKNQLQDLRDISLEKDNRVKRAERRAHNAEVQLSKLEDTYSEALKLRKEDIKIPKWTSQMPKKSGAASVVHPVLMLSDLHFDEVVDIRHMGGVNEYNREIATARLERTIDMTVKYLQTYTGKQKIEGISVFSLGDVISGDIHEELAATNEHPPAETCVYFVPLLASALTYLADKFERVHVECIDGNHDRTGKPKKFKRRAEEAWTWVLYHWLADSLRDDKRITFRISRSSQEIYSVYETTFLLAHGDGARGGGGIGGIYVPVNRWAAKQAEVYSSQGITFDYACIGHFHQSIYGDRVIINGSMKGYDEFARAHGFPVQKPMQNLFLISPEYGLTMMNRIFCEG